MRQEEPRGGDLIGPLDWWKILPFEPAAASDRLGWVGLQAVRYRAAPACGTQPARHDPSPAHPLCPAAGGVGPAV